MDYRVLLTKYRVIPGAFCNKKSNGFRTGRGQTSIRRIFDDVRNTAPNRSSYSRR